ncbi:GIY-YIG nuclease family protein [Streptomyces malaysiensis]|uniref:GIY-YIG nuclease family protein n=1 Tax=Streptomyces malaysiensis TaxID=92644 RepID=UPI002B288607|nr:GIY-YIG nuclease family protein [Streptomyces malaysiensis]
MPKQGSSNSAEFKLSITKALRDQLGASLEGLTPSPLTPDEIDKIERHPGVYQLYHRDVFVYVGKADSLRSRLAQHRETIRGRLNISPDEMTFTCLYVDEDLPTIAPERLLIDWHKSRGEIPWNTSGIGNHDPGVKRDSTTWGTDHFYTLYPIDLSWPVGSLTPEEAPLSTLISQVKKQLPYTFRFKKASAVYSASIVKLGKTTATADEIFALTAASLPPGWQITALPGYVTMYDKISEAPGALRTYRSPHSPTP